MANQSSARMNRDKRRPTSPGTGLRASAAFVREAVDSGPQIAWSPATRGVVSALILFHLAAAFVAALVAAPPVSELSSAMASIFRPYINAVDLNHGYRFFAPDPGPSHLVRYHLEFADGSKHDGLFPNLEEERPRLLYHRYFMLSEKLYGFYSVVREIDERRKEPQFESTNSDPAARAALQQLEEARKGADAAYQAFARSYGNELLRRTGAKRVTLELVEHFVPPPEFVADGKRLNDPSLYVVRDTLGPYGEGGVPEVIR
jgi:hypothetical protein